MTATASAITRPALPRSVMALVFVCMLIGGALRSVEAGCQNSMKLALKNVWLCGVISYAVALTGVALILAASPVFSSRRRWPTRADLAAMPKWAPFGGLTGGAAIFAGQMLLATAMDHFGVMGFPRRRVNVQRLAACAMIVAGSYLMAKY